MKNCFVLVINKLRYLATFFSNVVDMLQILHYFITSILRKT